MTFTFDTEGIMSLGNFFKACRGNWHNACYVDCDKCKNSECRERDYIFAPDYNGRPAVMKIGDLETLGNEIITKEDCLFFIRSDQFLDFYDRFIVDTIDDTTVCPLIQLAVKYKT